MIELQFNGFASRRQKVTHQIKTNDNKNPIAFYGAGEKHSQPR
jgi:hypothetical protein